MAADDMSNVSRTVLTALDTMNNHLQTMTTTQDSKAVAYSMIESHKHSIANFERLTLAIDRLDKLMKSVQSTGGSRRQLSESRCVGSLKVLGSDKLEFKNWNDKLVNVTSQAFGTSWRGFMKTLNRKLDQDRKWTTGRST